MNQNEVEALAAALAEAYRDAAERHRAAAEPKPTEPEKYVKDGILHAPPMAEAPAPAAVHRELARDYNEMADAIERAAGGGAVG